MNPEMLTHDIRQRERELHEMQDLRISQLEAEITKRDNLIIEVSKRYTQLQEDFKYNLGLITARDLEITRLDDLIKSRTTDFESADSENRSLRIKIETMESTHSEREKAWEQERQANKELLREVKSLCDQMQYKHDEDIRILNREIDYLRLEAQRAAVARDECLESQRKDLIETYEGIMQHNEQAHQKKVDEISGQIEKLDKRIEQMQTEALKHKSDLAEAHRESEKLSAELAAAEEARRQLKWQLDDERSSKTVTDDTLQRQLLSAQLEAATTRESLNKELEDLKKLNEKVQLEAQREKEFRSVAEKRLEEAKVVFQHDKQLLLVEINEYRVHETMLQNEVTTLREERDSSLNRGASLRLELEAADVRIKTVQKESDLLRAELAAERARVSDGEGKLTKLSLEFQQYREDAREKEYKAMQSAADQILDNKNTAYEEVRVLKEMHESEMKRVREKLTSDLQQCERECEERVQALELQSVNKAAEVVRLRAELEEAQRNTAAVQMRLDIKEESISRLTREVKELETKQQSYLRSLQQHHLHGGGGGAMPGGQLDLSHLDLNQSLDHNSTGGGLPMSPAFSTDFGGIPSISFPNSPMPSYLGGTTASGVGNNANSNRFRMLDGQATSSAGTGGGAGGRLTAQQVLNSTQYMNLQSKYDDLVIQLDQALAEREQLAAENEKLKNNSKEMREILDHLQSDAVQQQKASEKKLAEKEEQLLSLEVQIDKLVEECNRLRSEGKRLMDTCNELRAANHQLTRQLNSGNGGATAGGLINHGVAVPATTAGAPMMAATPLRGVSAVGSGFTNVFDYVTSSPAVLNHSSAAGVSVSAASPYHNANHSSSSSSGSGLMRDAMMGYQPSGLTLNPAFMAGSHSSSAAPNSVSVPPVSPSRLVQKDHISTVDQYHRVWGNLTYGKSSPASAAASNGGPLSPKPVVATIPTNSQTTIRQVPSQDQEDFYTASHYEEVLGLTEPGTSYATTGSAAAAPPQGVSDTEDSLDPRHQQQQQRRKSVASAATPTAPTAASSSTGSSSSKPTRRHTMAAPMPPHPPSSSAASKLFKQQTDDSEPDADILPISSTSGSFISTGGLNLEGHSIRSASVTSAATGGAGAGMPPQTYVNRGVSVFHKSGLPVPISNSDRETSSQSKALSNLKMKSSSITSGSSGGAGFNNSAHASKAASTRRNSTVSSVPTVRNYALGEAGDLVS